MSLARALIMQTNQKRFSIFVQRATFKICERYLFGKGGLELMLRTEGLS